VVVVVVLVTGTVVLVGSGLVALAVVGVDLAASEPEIAIVLFEFISGPLVAVVLFVVKLLTSGPDAALIVLLIDL
jgi:hypothetical protein